MRLILEWSTGEYDDFSWHCTPFEWESPEALFCLIEEKKLEYNSYIDFIDQNRERICAGQITQEEALSHSPKPIVDQYNHELYVELFISYSAWTTDLTITPLEEWFTK